MGTHCFAMSSALRIMPDVASLAQGSIVVYRW